MSLHGNLAALSFHGDFEAFVNLLQAYTLVMTNLWQACTLVMTNLWQACTLVMTNLWQACCKLKLLSGLLKLPRSGSRDFVAELGKRDRETKIFAPSYA
ncbi:hypothetical protein AVEN_246344-1 [Araneus ventricosus]|uniref:Uncharacterized protein n=1 Tax=Araneus ventricosus TaxID=182803 RepID=A0A4Y2UQX4_ARAVE|nr:hypothetical protein AVEN_246344-1 [Araneus ventricosus]